MMIVQKPFFLENAKTLIYDKGTRAINSSCQNNTVLLNFKINKKSQSKQIIALCWRTSVHPLAHRSQNGVLEISN